MKNCHQPDYCVRRNLRTRPHASHSTGALRQWIDLFGLPKPQYLKIDVDGHELPVLRGASESLRHCRQVFIEIEDAKHAELDDMFSKLGLAMTEKHPVQNYEGLWNCIYSQRT